MYRIDITYTYIYILPTYYRYTLHTYIYIYYIHIFFMHTHIYIYIYIAYIYFTYILYIYTYYIIYIYEFLLLWTAVTWKESPWILRNQGMQWIINCKLDKQCLAAVFFPQVILNAPPGEGIFFASEITGIRERIHGDRRETMYTYILYIYICILHIHMCIAYTNYVHRV